MTTIELHQWTERLCAALIQAPSLSGDEKATAVVLRKAMEALGYDMVMVDCFGSVIGCIRGKRPGKRVLLDGHIDTVPVNEPERWTVAPFGGEIRGGRLWGRGATDMKGAVAAMTCGAAWFAEHCDRDFAGEIYVAGVVQEELFEGVACREISKAVRPDVVIIGEATELNLKIGQRGRGEIVVETVGKPAHSANPEKGVNAVRLMMRFLARLETLPVAEQPGLGSGIMELTDIISSPYPGSSVVPERCLATFDRRLLVGETPETVLAPIQAVISDLAAQDPDFSARVYLREESKPCYTGAIIHSQRFFPGWRFDESEAFVQKSAQALHEAGLMPELTTYSFCTNGSHYAGEAGIPTLGFGPSRENLAHTVDEYVELDQLHKSAGGYATLLQALTKD